MTVEPGAQTKEASGASGVWDRRTERARIDTFGAGATFVHVGPLSIGVIGRLRYTDRKGTVHGGRESSARAIAIDWEDGPVAVLGRCDGEYALAIHHESSRRMIVSVDRFAARAVYVAVRDDRVAFGIDPFDVARSLGEAPRVSNDAIFAYMWFHSIPAPLSICRNVVRLDVGQYLDAGPAGVRIERFWSPEFREEPSIDFEASRHDFLGAIRAGVTQCVEDLDPDRVGCFLSGGTDSSTLSKMLGEVTGRPARTFSIGFDVDGYDERHYSRLAARAFGTRHVEYAMRPDDVLEGIHAVATRYEQPFGNASAVPTYFCARLAREHGIDLLLGGDGGDELFGGNERYATQRIFGHYERLPAVVRREVLERVLPRLALRPSAGWLYKAKRYVEQARVPLPARLHTYNPVLQFGLDGVFERDFLQQTDITCGERIETDWWALSEGKTQINRLLAYDFKFTLGDNDLRKVGTMCSAAGVDVAFPMLARPVVDLSLTLPSDEKLRGTQLRYFFKRALRGYLPDEILDKSKHGFGMPFGDWMMAQPSLQALAAETMRSLVSRGILRPAFVDALTKSVRDRHAGYFGTMVWLCMTLELWMREHVDAR